MDFSGLLKPENFPEENGEARFTVVVAGPGDEIWIPDLVEFETGDKDWQ